MHFQSPPQKPNIKDVISIPHKSCHSFVTESFICSSCCKRDGAQYADSRCLTNRAENTSYDIIVKTGTCELVGAENGILDFLLPLLAEFSKNGGKIKTCNISQKKKSNNFLGQFITFFAQVSQMQRNLMRKNAISKCHNAVILARWWFIKSLKLQLASKMQ